MKKLILITLVVMATLTSNGQENKLPSWVNNLRLSGYGITQYQYSGQDGAKSNTFNLRLVRISLDGRILGDFAWKAQIQFNGNTSQLGSSPRLVDLFGEWQKYKFLRLKVGQFKRPFTYDNPIHPVDQGFMSVAQSVTQLAGFSDRHGGHSSNGRDMGVQLQGDLLQTTDGHSLIHYAIGVFNGQGINTKDVDQRKDIIGGISVMPIEGLRLGVFGWEGSYAREGTWTENNETHTGIRSLPQHRYAISGEYSENDWTFRSEYIHSTGFAFAKTYQSTSEAKDCTLSSNGNKADGFYALAIVPIIKKKLHVKSRYDLYRKTGEWSSAKTMYEFGADYEFAKNMEISAEYARVNDRNLAKKHDYNMVDVQFSFRF